MLVMAAPVEIVTFEDSDFNCVPVNAAPVAVPLPDTEIPGTTGSLPITRVGNDKSEVLASTSDVATKVEVFQVESAKEKEVCKELVRSALF